MTSKTHGEGAAFDGPRHPEPTLAELARTLIHLGRIGTLSTHSKKKSGYPFGSLAPYAADEQGSPLFLISGMAMHTQNLQRDPKASLLVVQSDAQGDPLGAGRVTLVGDCVPVSGSQVEAVRKLYLDLHPNARHWVEYSDFGFYRLLPSEVYMVGGFGVMGWVSADDYRQARPDPLADAGPEIISHMNQDHADALALLARRWGSFEVEEGVMTAVDRLGFNVRLRTPEGFRGLRIPFPSPVASPEETRKALVAMVREARQTEQG